MRTGTHEDAHSDRSRAALLRQQRVRQATAHDPRRQAARHLRRQAAGSVDEVKLVACHANSNLSVWHGLLVGRSVPCERLITLQINAKRKEGWPRYAVS